MNDKSDSISRALVTIAILGQPPRTTKGYNVVQHLTDNPTMTQSEQPIQYYSSAVRNSEQAGQMVTHCINECRRRKMVPIILALPFTLPDDELRKIIRRPEIVGIMSGNGITFDANINHFIPYRYDWAMPYQHAATLAVLGPRTLFSFQMIRVALQHRVKRLIYTTPIDYLSERTVSFLLARLLEKGRYVAEQLFQQHAPRVLRNLTPLIGRRFRKVLDSAQQPLLQPDQFIANRIVLINTSLLHGGAERQVVNTLTGLAERGYQDVTLLCDSLEQQLGKNFFHQQLQQANIEVAEIRHFMNAEQRLTLQPMIERIEQALAPLPTRMGYEILYYVCEFLLRRPQVVHLWQDVTNIKGGIAAALVGVPKIILTTRNMSANRFAYFHSYMLPGYQLLAEHPNLILSNNSQAGASDYETWLGLPAESIHVLHNGFDSNTLQQPTEAAIAAYRERLGLPPEGLVVGSMFRFNPEKDPLLWIRTAKKISDARADVLFLLIGSGDMHDAIRTEAETLGIADRLFTPGNEKEPALPLALFDLLLLTSKMEGTPNIVIEAQWLGTPVVATDAGGTREALKEGETGWIIDQRDADQLAQCTVAVLNDPPSNSQQAGQRVVRERFGMEQMIDETLAMYGLR